MGRIDELLDRQAVDLDLLTGIQASLVLTALEDARRELRERLDGAVAAVSPGGPAGTSVPSPATTQQLRVMLAQVESGVVGLRRRMATTLAASEVVLQERALESLVEVVQLAEPRFLKHGAELDVPVLARLTEERGLALHRYSVDRYGAQVVESAQRELVAGYAQGQTVFELSERVAGVDGSIARHRGRGELIVRMELARVYDTGAQISLEEAARLDPPDDPDPLLKRADEYFDARNHPFSRLLDGLAVLPDAEWEVPVSGQAAKGLVWPVINGVARGRGYPAHYHDRGRQVPYRKSWDDL